MVGLNVYPPSRDAATAPAATLWCPAAANLAPLLAAAVCVARGELCSATDSQPPRDREAVRAALRAAIAKGVPLWNSGRQAACTAEYLRVCRELGGEDSRLGDAAERASQENDAHEGGWILRHAMDAVIRDIAAGQPVRAAGGRPDAQRMGPVDVLLELKELLESGDWPERPAPGTRPRQLIAALYGHICEADDEPLVHAIGAGISVGVPMWNSGRFAQCTVVYRTIATHRRSDHPLLDAALAMCANAGCGSGFDDQGWVLRRHFDLIIDESSDEGESEEESSGEDGWQDGMHEIPSRMICPITQRLLKDPVVAADGNTYERVAITRWFRRKRVSPLTNLPISDALVPNRALADAIEEFRKAAAAPAAAAPDGATAEVGADSGAVPAIETADEALTEELVQWFRGLGLRQEHMDAIVPVVYETGATEPIELAEMLEDETHGVPAIEALTAKLPVAKRKRFRSSLDQLRRAGAE